MNMKGRIVLIAALRLLRAPSFFLGAASQASIGGYSSAPVVAEIYQAGLAPVGLLLAVVGNVLGTYLDLGFTELVFHFPGDDQSHYLELFARDVLPLLRERTPAQAA